MDDHIAYLKKYCRLCGNRLKDKKRAPPRKETLKAELWLRFRINVDIDREDIHPPFICLACQRMLYRIRNATEPEKIEVSKKLHSWKSHSDENCDCQSKQGKGRPSKKTSEQRKGEEAAAEKNGSDTESGEESEEEQEKMSCMEFSALMQNIGLMDRELAIACAEKLAEEFNFIFLDRENLASGIKSLSSNDKILLTSSIFSQEKEHIKSDISSCCQTYKCLPSLLKVTPHEWTRARNSILSVAINSLCHENIKPVQKAATSDQLYSLVQPSYISPFMFATNLLAYSVTRSKLALNMYGKLHPAGGNTTVRSWLDNLTMNVPSVPSGDILTAVDNDQVLIKKWTVRKDNRAQISVLTSVCVASVNPDGTLQQNPSLAPRAWFNCVNIAKDNPVERKTLLEACSVSEADKDIIRRENKQLVHELLKELLKEHTKVGQVWKDEIDNRVEEMKSKEGKRVCPVCHTMMERTRRKCINPDCRVSLKAAEKEVQGSDILGTALVAPIPHYRHRVRETQLGFVINENEEARVLVNEEVTECYDEFQHVPSNHPDHPVKVVASDPVFVNPNSPDALKEVLRRIGKASNVKRYNPDDPNARHWLNVTMDGLPYLVCRKVVQEMLLCTECGDEVLKESLNEHCLKVHQGQRCNAVQEFDWVVLRIGKLHLEMNMARHFMDLNWNVFLSKLASELGFVSEAAQKFVHKGSDHHKAMSVLKVAHIGLWKELLIPYIRDRLSSGAAISVNDYLYKWIPEVGWNNATYRYIFGMTWTYLMSLHVFRMGVRRNNNAYVRAGQMSFAPLFHRNGASKYALIDLHDSLDRALYPNELAEFVGKTESISTSGNSSKGEDMDACLEEVNKDSKVWQHGSMVALDWLRIFRNLENLSKVRNWLFSLIGLRNPKDESAQSRRKYDFNNEVLAWRIKLRKERYLKGEYSDEIKSLEGPALDQELKNYEEVLQKNRSNLLNTHFLEGKKRGEAEVQTLFVTAEERASAEDIKNANKEEIVKRIAEKLQQVSDEDIREVLVKKFDLLKVQHSKVKKEHLIMFYNEVIEELQQQAAQDEICITEEEEQEG